MPLIFNYNNITIPFEDFILRPAKCSKDKSSKATVVALSVLLGIATLGIIHAAFAIKNKMSANVLRVDQIRKQSFPHSSKLSLSNPEWIQAVLNDIESGSMDDFKKHIDEGNKLGYLDKTFTNRGPLFIKLAKADSHIERMKYLLTKKINPAIAEEEGNSGLIWAIANASNTMALFIINTLKKGEYLNVQDFNKKTALHLAIAKGYEKLSKQGDVLEHTNFEIVEALLKHAAKVNIQDEHGNTPLHYACYRRDEKMIKALMEKGADPTLKNGSGKTPLEVLSGSFYEAEYALRKATEDLFILDHAHFESANLEALKQLLVR